ncbi:S-layer homology domain-containing protein [Clostridium formicaceticum]|uniref:Endo-1,4-beta-xylanase A n=1 Tax=Clostridium formicaceticum TaxID=1497 RepID=A0AAC9WGV1_9CLOT|nr:S-layer homology domain-containing protein [Clostridium formicaceticum]AOY76622.1 hypothetical protein BJL90_12565 [Clostridium formicaceticum]ARE87045.1 Endo-1,4-beta-xylanase A precursor [Clostridium formicaceticum]
MNRVLKGKWKAAILLVSMLCIHFLATGSLAFAEGSIIRISGDGVLQETSFTMEALKSITDGKVKKMYTMQTLVEPHSGEYEGVDLYDLLKNTVGLKEEASTVKIISSDGVSMDFTMEEVKKKDYVNDIDDSKLPIILAYEKEGHPLVVDKNSAGFLDKIGNDGGPLRLMVGQTVKGERNSPKCLKHVSEVIVTAEEKKIQFTDVGQFYIWAKDGIEALAEQGIIKGIGENKFAPEKQLTRAEFAVILVKALDLDVSEEFKGSFVDVFRNDWHAAYVEAAAKYGLIKGYPDGSFGPNKEVNRQEMTVMVIQAMGLKEEAKVREGKNITYRDKEKIPAWVIGSVEIAQEKGLLENIVVGYFNGEKPVNRAEAAVMVYRMLQ